MTMPPHHISFYLSIKPTNGRNSGSSCRDT
jgi:hypothetical protein